MPTATFPEILVGFSAFLPIDSMTMRTKFEVRIALPVHEIIGGTQKIGQSMDTPTVPFLQNC